MSRHPVVRGANIWSRKLHRLGAVLTALPVLVIIGSGLLLQMKKQSTWVQPPTARGSAGAGEGGLAISFDQILAAAAAVEHAGIRSWDDVDRLDVRPDKGVVKVRANSRWEVQIDTATGEVLQTAYRRSDLIEQIHDGSFFGGDAVKLGIFLPSAAVLLALWITGVYLWLLPVLARRKRLRVQRTRLRG